MQPTILIVDDDTQICGLLEMALEDLDVRIVTVHDGLAALEVAREKTASVIVCDYHLPGMDGLQFLRELNAAKIMVPCIWISGYADENIFREAWKTGVFEVMEKPLDMKKFRAAVEAAIVYGIGFVKLKSHVPTKKVSFVDVPISLDPTVFGQLKAYCDKKNVAVSEHVRNLIEASLKSNAA